MNHEAASLQKSLRIYQGLVEVSGLINSITDFDELLRQILAVARRVMHAEAASLFLTNDASGGLDLAMSSRADDEFVQPRIFVPRGQGISGWVLEHEESLLIPDAYADHRFFRDADKKSGFRTRSMLCAPLKQEGKVIGVIQVLNSTDGFPFDQIDLEAFEAYSSLTATAIDKLRFIERMREQERVQRDVQIASEIQQELLSQAVPTSLEGYAFGSHYKAAQNVGGDFFLVYPREPDVIFFAIGDVSGKGISASLLMAQTLSAMQFVFATTDNPAAAMAMLNTHAERQIVRGMFVTMLIGLMNRSNKTLALASAGHCRPWVVRQNGECEEIQTAGALPLGILPDIAYEQIEVPFGPGDVWVSFTDGLTESRSPHTGDFFESQIPHFLAGTVPEPCELVSRLIEAEAVFRDGDDPRDDLTLLAGGFR
ncbi:MAG: PP2C family protein-serine/threonine phosphatase [Chthoniobacterales bacterium]